MFICRVRCVCSADLTDSCALSLSLSISLCLSLSLSLSFSLSLSLCLSVSYTVEDQNPAVEPLPESSWWPIKFRGDDEQQEDVVPVEPVQGVFVQGVGDAYPQAQRHPDAHAGAQ